MSTPLYLFTVVIGVGLLQTWALDIGGLTLKNLARFLAAGFILGIAPGFMLRAGADRIKRLKLTSGQSSAVFWSPALLTGLGWLWHPTSGVRDRWTIPYLILLTTLALINLAVWYVHRRRSHIYGPLPARLALTQVAWLALTLFYVKSFSARDDAGLFTLRVTLIVALLGPLILIARIGWHQFWSGADAPARRRRLYPLATLVVSLIALGIILWVHFFLIPGVYFWLATWTSLCVAIGLRLLAPWTTDELWTRTRRARLGAAAMRAPIRWASLALIALSFAATCWLFLVPIPTRFGALPSRSIIGSAIRVISLPDDADGDGFYAQKAGGNDCNDEAAKIHPMAARSGRHCWATRRQKKSMDLKSMNLPKDGERETEYGARSTHSKRRAEHAVILINDAMRADVLEGASGTRNLPNLTRFARQNLEFTQAYPPGNSTLQSIPSMLSGISPIHALRSLYRNQPVGRREFLAPNSIFDQDPAEFCSIFINTMRGPIEGLVDTFEEHLEVGIVHDISDHEEPSIEKLVDEFELALHDCDDRRVIAVLYHDQAHRDDPAGGYRCRDGTVGERRCYMESLSVVDEQFARLEAILDEHDLLDDTFLVVTADHGEAFGAHGYRTHATSVFQDQIHVPLLVQIPDAPADEIDTPVSLLDLKASLVDALDLPNSDPASAQKHSWFSAGEEESAPSGVIINNWAGRYRRSWTAPSSAYIVEHEKLIYDWRTNYLRLYDLNEDPSEQYNLAKQDPDRARELFEEFQRLHTAQLLER